MGGDGGQGEGGLGVKQVVAHIVGKKCTGYVYERTSSFMKVNLFFSALTLSCWAVAARKREAEKRAHVTEGRSLMLVDVVCGLLWWGVWCTGWDRKGVRTNLEHEQPSPCVAVKGSARLQPRHQQT